MGDTAHLEAASTLLDQMDDRAVLTAEFLLLDAQFHVTLALATGNAVVAAIMTSLRDAISSYVLRSASVLPDWPAMAKRLRREHRAVLAAVCAGDGELAARRVARHIEGFYRATRWAEPARSRRDTDRQQQVRGQPLIAGRHDGCNSWAHAGFVEGESLQRTACRLLPSGAGLADHREVACRDVRHGPRSVNMTSAASIATAVSNTSRMSSTLSTPGRRFRWINGTWDSLPVECG